MEVLLMIDIYGGGLAGLISANMLRSKMPVIHEKQKELPNNHGALLRFRSDIVSKVTGVPFKKVNVRKGIWANHKYNETMTINLQNMYSQKVVGRVLDRSIINIDDCIRYIAPSDLIAKISKACKFKYKSPLTMDKIKKAKKKGLPIISTIPMPVLMEIVDWYGKLPFLHKPIWTFRRYIVKPYCDIYQTVYFPELNLPYYRASLTGNLFTLEFISDPGNYDLGTIVNHLLKLVFGIEAKEFSDDECKYQKYGKLSPIPNIARREFILAMTDMYGIYSIGRFATWRQLLLDDIVQDVNIVESMIDQRDNYSRSLKEIKS